MYTLVALLWKTRPYICGRGRLQSPGALQISMASTHAVPSVFVWYVPHTLRYRTEHGAVVQNLVVNRAVSVGTVFY